MGRARACPQRSVRQHIVAVAVAVLLLMQPLCYTLCTLRVRLLSTRIYIHTHTHTINAIDGEEGYSCRSQSVGRSVCVPPPPPPPFSRYICVYGRVCARVCLSVYMCAER